MRTYQTYLFDLDGTIYLGDELLPGASQTISRLKETGAAIRYVTNNPTRLASDYARKLTSLGITTAAEEVITSVTATTRWLKSNAPSARVFAIGEAPLIQALSDAGIRLSDDPAEIDIVLASFDRTFTYEKLQIAFDALWFHRRAVLLATNPDKYCPYPGGRGEPDAAAIVAAIEASTGVRVEETFGKPGPLLARMALNSIPRPVEVGQCVMVGDRLHTDIAMGKNAGMDTALVLTGDSTREEVEESGTEPTWVIDTLAELLGSPASAAAPRPPQTEEKPEDDDQDTDR